MYPKPNMASLWTLAIYAGSLYIATRVLQAWYIRYKLSHIPSVGTSAPLLSYLGAAEFFRNAQGLIHEGYQKHRGYAFKIPSMTGWIVVVSGKDRIDELRKAPDHHASFQASLNETLQNEFTLGKGAAKDPYHVDTVRNPLTRNISTRFQDVQDEIVCAFTDHIPPTEDWSTVPILPAVMDITCRTSNRLFVDLPLCRNKDYLKLNIDFTADVVKTGTIIALFPELFRPIAARFISKLPKSIVRGLSHLRPILEERLKNDTKYGNKYEGRPNDLISWLLDTGTEHNREPVDLTTRILTINFAAIHTTSMAFTQVLFDLAQRPEYVPELREEIETIVNEEGITKLSLEKMLKLDSFIKESQRIGGIQALSLQRMMLKDFTFSDGLVIPQGTLVAVPNGEIQLDEENYSDPRTFDGFRFIKMAQEADTYNKYSTVALSADYIVFGSGRRACPGRFFAVNEMKAFFVHLLMNYDFKLNPDAPTFTNLWFNANAVPDPSATLLVRKRKV